MLAHNSARRVARQSRRDGQAVEGQQGARFPGAARPELVTQCNEDRMHAEARHGTAGATEKEGGGSVVPVPMAVVVVMVMMPAVKRISS